MIFAQFFPTSASSHAPFLIADCLTSYGYYSEEAESTELAVGDYAARDTRANDGLLKLWSFGGSLSEIHMVAYAWSANGDVPEDERDDFAQWLLVQLGASVREAAHITQVLFS